MEDWDDGADWRVRLRDELVPYAAFYGVGLLWLTSAGMIGAWSPGLAWVLAALTAMFGIPTAALVTLMMLWRVAMVGIDCGRIVPLASATCAAIGLFLASASLAFPSLALGHVAGLWQQKVFGWVTGVPVPARPEDCGILCPW